MKTIHISKGGMTAISIQVHDPELNIVVHDSVEVTEAHAHIHLDAATNGEYTGGKQDYSHLIGKWVKCIYVEDNKKGLNKWFKVVSLSNHFKDSIVIEHPDGVDGFNVKHFDISNPSDTDPDELREVKVPFDASRIAEAVRFEMRDGREVKCVVVNDIDVPFPVTGFIENINVAISWTRMGSFYRHNDSRYDLFMVVKEVRND